MKVYNIRTLLLLLITVISVASIAVIAADKIDKNKKEVPKAPAKEATTSNNKKTDFEQIKQNSLKIIDKRMAILSQTKACVNGADNITALKSCNSTYRVANNQFENSLRKQAKAAQSKTKTTAAQQPAKKTIAPTTAPKAK